MGLPSPTLQAAPAATIAEAQLPADLIAMATHGQRGFALLPMGSVTAATLLQTRVPLLLVRPPP